MRNEAAITSISWIPSEAVRGLHRSTFDSGVAHYDPPPPGRLDGSDHLEELRRTDRFRFANTLSAWIEVDDGEVVGHGSEGGGQIGSTSLALGSRTATFAAVPFPDIVHEPELGDGFVRFRVTAGGRTGVPMPRRVIRFPFVQVSAPTAWATIELTLFADGRHEARIADASQFPRHWLYGHDGCVISKSGTVDYRRWIRSSFGDRTPWGDEGAGELGSVVVGEVESELERRLSHRIMGADVDIVKHQEGDVLIREGEPGDDVYLLLDGVVSVSVGGRVVAELGPGAVLGERSAIDGWRTATVECTCRCTFALAAAGGPLLPDEVAALADEHCREDQPG